MSIAFVFPAPLAYFTHALLVSLIDPGDDARFKKSDNEALTRYCGHCEVSHSNFTIPIVSLESAAAV